MIDILYEDNHLLVVEKPCNIPVQADSSKDDDLLSLLKAYIKDKYQKPGNVYLGLVHRLDRPVGGVMVFARTSKAASRLSKMIAAHEFEKIYLACVKDNGLKDSDRFVDHLIKDPKTNMVHVDPKGKEAILDYEVMQRKGDLALVKIKLKTGRSHQIRVQFASRKHPLYGDHRYDPECIKNTQIALWSHKLCFRHPVSNEELVFTSFPHNRPFDRFKEALNE